MRFKNNLKKIMQEKEISLNHLSKICEGVSINTLRKLKNNESCNLTLDTAERIATALGCSIKELFEDNITVLLYDEIAEASKEHLLFMNKQVFSPCNLEYLKQLFFQAGISCDVSSHNYYNAASIKNDYELSSIQVDIELRVMQHQLESILIVNNFYIGVNEYLHNEEIVKASAMKALELYALKINVDEIHFVIEPDYKKRTNQILNSLSEIPANFNLSIGTGDELFINNNYTFFAHPIFKKYSIEWRKKIS